MIENEKTHSAKYQVLYNRLTNGTPFTTDTAQARITALADARPTVRISLAGMRTSCPRSPRSMERAARRWRSAWRRWKNARLSMKKHWSSWRA